MKNTFIDISGDKALSDQSPIPIMAWVICYLITAVFIQLDLMFVLLVLIEFVLCQIFFQYKPRTVFLGFRFLSRHTIKSPTHYDENYVVDSASLSNLKRILKEKKDAEGN